jgi:hypothetical protein
MEAHFEMIALHTNRYAEVKKAASEGKTAGDTFAHANGSNVMLEVFG